jgi:hypothetical protein
MLPLMELKSKLLKTNKNLIAFILFVVFWFSLVLISGTLTSGYHFTDDHGIISINKTINDSGVLNTCESVIKTDLNIRLRPFYYFHRVIEIKLLGTNFLFWSIYNVILAVLTSFFLYLFIERQGYKFLHAILFPFLTLIGAQSSIWWRLGPAETIGFFLLATSLFFLANSIFRGKQYQLIISFIFLFFASLSKESFTFFIPAYLLILLWLQQQHGPNRTISNSIKKNSILLVSLLVLFFVEIYIIIFVVGTNKIGYAGIDNSFTLSSFLKFIYTYLRHNIYIYLIVFGLFLLLQNIKTWNIKSIIDVKISHPFIFNLAIFSAIVFPQFLLYNKSGISDRYLLPFNLGFSIFVLFLLNLIYESSEISLFSKRAYVCIIIIITYSLLKNEALQEAKGFARVGVATNKFLSTIVDNSKPDDSILVVLNTYENYEWAHSVKLYLTLNANRKNIMFLPISKSLNDNFSKSLENGFVKKFNNLIVKEEGENYSCIAILPFEENKGIKNKLDSNYLYQRNDCDKFDYFTVYTKK